MKTVKMSGRWMGVIFIGLSACLLSVLQAQDSRWADRGAAPLFDGRRNFGEAVAIGVPGQTDQVLGVPVKEPRGPKELAYAYVVDLGAANVSVIDVATSQVVEGIDLAQSVRHPYGIAVTPDGARAYVSGIFTPVVLVVDLQTREVTGRIPTQSAPGEIVISPDGSRAYVVHRRVPRGLVSVIDTNSDTVIATVALGSGSDSIAVTPKGDRLYVTNIYSHSVSVIETGTYSLLKEIPVGTYPEGIAVHPDGSLVYVADDASPTIWVLSTADDAIVDKIDLTVSAPVRLAITPDGSALYVAHMAGSKSGARDVPAFLEGGAWRVEGAGIGRGGRTGSVSVVDTKSKAVRAVTQVGGAPWHVALTRDGGALYVANADSGSVSVLDADGAVVATIPGFREPQGIAIP